MLGCLCCGGWVGDPAQGPIFKVLSCPAPVQWNRMRVPALESAPKVVFFRLVLVDFVAGLWFNGQLCPMRAVCARWGVTMAFCDTRRALRPGGAPALGPLFGQSDGLTCVSISHH